MVGRGLRPAPGKSNLILIDHSGAVYRHGLLEDKIEWTLDTTRRAGNPAHDARSTAQTSRLIECSQCGALRTGGEPCPACRFLPKRRPDAIIFRDGELARVDRSSHQPVQSSDPHERMRWHGMLTYIQQQNGHKPGWVYWKFKEKFGTAPFGYAAPIEPSPEVLSWVRRYRLRQGHAETVAVMSRKWKRNRQTTATPSGQWCGRPREMLESAAYRVLSRAGHHVLSRIELELRYHAGKDNGRLPVTFENFVSYGVHRHAIAPALREVQALGFVEITRGRAGNAEHRSPNLFRLTYEPIKDANPTNEWKRFAIGADAVADAKMMRDAANRRRDGAREPRREACSPHEKAGGQKQKPMPETSIGANAGNRHRNQKFSNAGNRHHRRSAETGITIDTVGAGRRHSRDPCPKSSQQEQGAMMTKRDIETLEQMIRSMTERQYWGLVGWLSNGMDGPLWQPRRRRDRPVPEQQDGDRAA